MPDLNDQLRRYIDGLEEPVSVPETVGRRSQRRFRVTAAVLAGAAIVLLPALVLIGLRWLPGGSNAAETTPVPVTTTTAMPETTVASGTAVSVEVPMHPTCLDYHSDLDNARSTTVSVLFECAPDGMYPDVSTPITRVLPITGDPIEATLQELLAGPTDEERAMGFSSWFSADSAGALNTVTLDGSRLIVDFNDDIIINNASTSTGGMYFLAELQANVFQFAEVDSVEFQIDGSCLAFGNWQQIGECPIWTRADWEQRVAAWDAERDLPPPPGEDLDIEDIVGKTFTTRLQDDSQQILTIDAGDTAYTSFNEVGGWLLDDTSADAATWKNWALHVTGQNAEMVWLVGTVDHTDDGVMVFTVRSVLVLPWDEILPESHGDPMLQDGATACTIAGESDPRLVVAADIVDGADGSVANSTHPLRAWRIDVDKGSFVEIPVDGIECLFDLS
jgi:hypothetical protein